MKSVFQNVYEFVQDDLSHCNSQTSLGVCNLVGEEIWSSILVRQDMIHWPLKGFVRGETYHLLYE